ncbi:MAG: hypothetical protein ACE5HA_14635 [Anaerolineae bacterium]
MPTSNSANETWLPDLGVPLEGLPQVQIIAQIQKEFVEQIMALGDDNLDIVLTHKSRAHYLRKHPEMRWCEHLLPRVLESPTEVYRIFSDPSQVIFVRRLLGGRYLMAGVLLDPTGQQKKHSVLTYYRLNPRTYRQLRNKGEVIWKRSS